MVWTLQFPAIGAFLVDTGAQGIVRTAHIPLRFRDFFLRNSHFSALSLAF